MVLKETEVSYCLTCHKVSTRKRLIYSSKFHRYVCSECYNKNPIFYSESI